MTSKALYELNISSIESMIKLNSMLYFSEQFKEEKRKESMFGLLFIFSHSVTIEILD